MKSLLEELYRVNSLRLTILFKISDKSTRNDVSIIISDSDLETTRSYPLKVDIPSRRFSLK